MSPFTFASTRCTYRASKKSHSFACMRTSRAMTLRTLMRYSSRRSLMIAPYKKPGISTSWCCGLSGLSAQHSPATKAYSLRIINTSRRYLSRGISRCVSTSRLISSSPTCAWLQSSGARITTRNLSPRYSRHCSPVQSAYCLKLRRSSSTRSVKNVLLVSACTMDAKISLSVALTRALSTITTGTMYSCFRQLNRSVTPPLSR